MVSLAHADEAPLNPLDLLEELVSANEWSFDRHSDSEMLVEVSGRWCSYHLYFVWQEDVGAMFFSCHMDQKIPQAKRKESYVLVGMVNENLWMGHFDLTSDDGSILFRHTVPVRGAGGLSVEQLEDLVDAAVIECERIYPALQMVVWGGTEVEKAMKVAMMETVGEA